VADQLTAAKYSDGQFISWREHLIDGEAEGNVRIRGGDGFALADLDQDGFADIISAHEDSSHIRMAFGSEKPDAWFLLSLAEGDEARAVEDIAIADFNGDGFPDVVAACEQGHLLYLQNPGGTVRGWRWKRLIPAATQGRGSYIRVFAADLDGDGHPEVIAANKGTDRPAPLEAEKPNTEISWFRVPADPLDGAAWEEHVLGTVKTPINSPPVDLDGDGDIDVFGGSRGEERVFWFENKGGDGPEFVEHRIEIDAGAAGGSIRINGFQTAFLDFNGDGRLDVALANSPSALVWLEQPADATQSWKLHEIGSIAPDHVTGITIADINNDGKPDIMTGGYSRGPRDEDGEEVTAADPVGRLAWFENPGGAGAAWTRHDISRRKRGMFDAFVARDIDGDGDLDFIATRGNSGKFDGVFWLEQLHSPEAVKVFQQAREEESEQLPPAP
jgi:hypothetical protein